MIKILMIAMFLFAGCDSGNNNNDNNNDCHDDSACIDGLKCVNGVCVKDTGVDAGDKASADSSSKSDDDNFWFAGMFPLLVVLWIIFSDD